MYQIKIDDIKRKKSFIKTIKKSKIKLEMSNFKNFGQLELVILIKKKNKYRVVKGMLSIEIAKLSGKDYIWCNILKNTTKNKLRKVLQSI